MGNLLDPNFVAGLVPLDLETFPVTKSDRLPAPVCAIIGGQDSAILTAWDPQWGATIRSVLSRGVTGHNIGYFDLPILAMRTPQRREVFDALADDRVWDTMIADRLGKIARGRYAKTWESLGNLAKRRCGIELDKGDDSFRVRYGELWGLPVEQWPQAAVDYARGDGLATWAVTQTQIKYCGDLIRDMGHQCRAAFALGVVAQVGFAIDADRLERQTVKWGRRKARLLRICEHFKTARPDGTRDLKTIQAYAVRAEQQIGRVLFPRTPKGALSITIKTLPDAEAVISLLEATEPEVCKPARVACKALKYAAKYGEAQRITGDGKERGLLSHLRGIDERGWFTYVARSRYDSLKETGRTGTSDPTIQNLPRKGNLRGVFTARQGYVLCSIDFAMLELVTLAECCLARVGYSKLADLINAKIDVHTWMGAHFAGIPYEEALALKQAKGKPWKVWSAKWRQMAKAFNFGIFGGLGPDKFMLLAHQEYGVTITREEFFRYSAIYHRELPEVKAYQKIIGGQIVVEHTHSRRLQGGMIYNSACNSDPQALGSDCMKSALWAIVWECYHPDGRLHGCHPVAEIHDEVIMEIPICDRTTYLADLATEVWVKAGQVWVPRVLLSAEPALMTHWSKSAECVRNDNGQLMVCQG